MGRTPANPITNRSRREQRGRAGPSHGPRQSLKSRILWHALLISIVPVLVIGMIALSSLVGLSRSAERNLDASREGLSRDVVGRAVRADAQSITREIDRVVGEGVGDLVELAESPPVRNAVRSAAETGDVLVITPTSELERQYARQRRLTAGSSAERYLRAVAANEPQFTELFFTERNGLTVAATPKPSDFVQSDETWWNAAWDDGLYLGALEPDEAAGAYGLVVATRIDGGGGESLGVIRGVVPLDGLHAVTTRIAEETGTDITVLTRGGLVLAETATGHDPARIATPNVEFEGDRADSVERAVAADSPGFVLADTTVAGYAPLRSVDGRLSSVLADFGDVDGEAVQWVTVVERSNDTAFAPLGGLSNVQQGLSETARRFGILLVVALLASLLAALLVATRLAQSIVRPLRSLSATARNIADNQLPLLVKRAQSPGGREADAAPILPTVELHTNDEISDVGDAFNVVSSTAAELAADQARSRRNVSRMFVSLGRRNQNLLNRQLEFIDNLERDTSDPDLLDDLFRLDHLATRMRRNAESLLVLAGEEPARRWSEPVSLTTVVRGAIGEVEDYRRVNLDGVEEAHLAGSAVGDVTHLMAELIENATQFSPPDTTVMVVGRRVVDGYALAVVDDGVGMSSEQLEDANRRIEASPQVDRVPSSFLGLFVVGRLAARHDIRVRLMESTTEGVTAKVLLPAALIDQPVPSAAPAALDTGRGRALPADTAAGAATTADDDAWIDVTDAASPPRRRAEVLVGSDAGAQARSGGPAPPSRDAQPQVDPLEDTAPFAPVRPDAGELRIVHDADRADEEATGGAPAIDAEGAVEASDAAHGPAAAGALQAPDAAEPPHAPREVPPVGAAAAEVDVGDEIVGDDEDAGDDEGERAFTAPPIYEVRRRASRRDGNGPPANGRPPAGRAVLRTERADAPRPGAERSADAPQHASTSATTDETGVTLTTAERDARAARDRLSRFQRAVQRGRAQSRAQHDGGEQRDA